MNAPATLPRSRADLARTLRSLRSAVTLDRDPVTGAARVSRRYTRRDLRRFAHKARAALES